MGYYVSLRDSTFKIHKGHLQDAYEAMCELNQHNDLKRGGRFPVSPDAPTNEPHDAVWFAWMSWNYHETCKDAAEILTELGFDTLYTLEGDLSINCYDGKAGNEDLFIQAIAPFSEGYLTWVGEDDSTWREVVEDGEIVSYTGRVVYD